MPWMMFQILMQKQKTWVSLHWLCLLLSLVIPCALVAIVLPEIAIVFGLLGSTCSTCQIYGLPGIILIKEAHRLQKKIIDNEQGGALYSSIATESSEHSGEEFVTAVVNGLVLEGEVSRSKDEEGQGRCHIPSLSYMPSNPLHLLLIGYFLVFLCVSIGILGTCTFIYSSIPRTDWWNCFLV